MANKTNKVETARVCFEILGRYFPNQNGKDSTELRKTLKVTSANPSNAEWKKGACDWLAENLSFKEPVKKITKKAKTNEAI